MLLKSLLNHFWLSHHLDIDFERIFPVNATSLPIFFANRINVLHTCNSCKKVKEIRIKGRVKRDGRPRLLYINRKLILRRRDACYKISTFLKDHCTIYIKHLQRKLRAEKRRAAGLIIHKENK